MRLEEFAALGVVVSAIAAVWGLWRGKSPQAEDNSQAQTAGDNSRNYQAGGDMVFERAPVADASPEPPASSITIKLTAEGHGSGCWKYDLEISFKNLSNRTLGEYRFEIEVPRFLLTPGTDYNGEIRERGTDLRAFIRRDETAQLEPLVYPGDSRRVCKIDVWRDKPLEPTESEASQTVTVTLYVDDQQAAREESQVRDLLA